MVIVIYTLQHKYRVDNTHIRHSQYTNKQFHSYNKEKWINNSIDHAINE